MSAAWFVWGFVPPSLVQAPPAWVELELIPALLGVLFLGVIAGLVASKGRSTLCWVAVMALGLQVLAAAMLMAMIWALRDF